MTRGCMHSTRPGFAARLLLLGLADIKLGFRVSLAAQGDMLANHQQRRPVEPCMPALESIELCSQKAREYLRRHTFARGIAFTKIAFCGDGFEQLRSGNVNLIAVFER